MNGRIIKGARQALGLTQRRLALSAGICERTVRNAERGKDLSPRCLAAICGSIGKVPDDVLAPAPAPRPAFVQWDAAMDRRALRMWEGGLGSVWIARELGVSRQAVSARMARLGARYNPRTQEAA